MHLNRRLLAALLLALVTSGLSTPPCSAAPAHGQVISTLDFRNISIADALKILSDQTGINVIASEKAGRIKTALFLREVSPQDVLEALAKAYHLWYQEDPRSGIVRVYTTEEFRLGQNETLSDNTEIFTLLHTNAADIGYAIRDLFGSRVSLSFGSNQQEALRELQQRFQRFDIVNNRTQGIGTSGGSSSGGSVGGGMSGGSSYGSGLSGGGMSGGSSYGGSQATLGNQPLTPGRVAEALPETQDLAKVGIAEQLAGDEESGRETATEALRRLAPIRVSVVQSQNRLLVRTRDADAMQQLHDLVAKMDVQASSVLLEVKALSVNLSDGLDSVFNFEAGTLSKDFTMGAKIAPGTQLDNANSMLVFNVNNQFLARVRALEQQGRVTAIATPMLLTTNHEVSRVFVGDERPIVTGYTSSSNSAVGGVGNVVQVRLVPQTEKRPVGTTLLMTPTINSDRSVNIRLIIEQSTVGAQASIPVDNGQGQIITVPVDMVSTRTFSGTVLARDKSAVAVGGLIEESLTDRFSKIPVLGDIPLLGALFTDTHKERKRNELVIIIKPHVMATPAESVEQSRSVLRENSLHPEAREENGFKVYGQDEGKPAEYEIRVPYEPLRP